MKKTILSERQTAALMNLGRAVNEALTEFPGRSAADVSSAAHQAYAPMLGLAGPAATVKPTPRKRGKQRKAKSKSKPAQAQAKTGGPPRSDKVVKIINVLQKTKTPMSASEIAGRLNISGQGLGPILNMLHDQGDVTKKDKDGVKLWGPKLNGKSTHVSVN